MPMIHAVSFSPSLSRDEDNGKSTMRLTEPLRDLFRIAVQIIAPLLMYKMQTTLSGQRWFKTDLPLHYSLGMIESSQV